ncbi:MAG: hypothetical protein U0414_43920 [Polyangiaceae bacterium]
MPSGSSLSKLLACGFLAAGLAGAGCLIAAEGTAPPIGSIYFPTALAISPGRTTLYVANSDFDLQFSGGSVEALDLGSADGLRGTARAVAQAVQSGQDAAGACASIGASANDTPFLHPGVCAPIEVKPLIKKAVSIGAFASSAVLLRRQNEGVRLFVAVRGDPSITYFDVVDDSDPANPVSPCGDAFCLECGADKTTNRCASDHLVGTDPFSNPRQLSLPTEPASLDGVALDKASGDALVIAHEASSAASLVVNGWPGDQSSPSLEYVLPNLDAGPISVVSIPVPRIARVSSSEFAYRAGFIVSHRASSVLSVLRYEDDAAAKPARPFLVRTGTVSNSLARQGDDQRGLAIDGEARAQCEAACAETNLPCMAKCLDIPLRFYVVSRAPASLLTGTIETKPDRTENEITGLTEKISLDEEIPLPFGPSAVRVGKIVDVDGSFATRIFAVSFDSRFVAAYNPVAHQIDAIIKTGRGPFGMAFDSGVAEDGTSESYLYVGHFTDSYLGVVDLDARRPTFGSFVVNVGPPVAPREEQ